MRAGSLAPLLAGASEEALETLTELSAAKFKLKLFPEGTIVFAKSGMSALKGYIYQLRQPCYVVSHLAALIPTPRVDPRYARWALESFSPTRLVQDPAYPSIRLPAIEDMEIPLPPLDQQRRIAAILDQADALRRKRRHTLESTDAAASATYIDMFGDPVTNPKSLEKGTLGDFVSSLTYGPRFYNESYVPDGTPIVRITDLDAFGRLDFRFMPRLQVSSHDLAQHACQTGDIIFARTGATVGKLALIVDSYPACIPGAYFIVMRFRSDILPAYAAATMRSSAIQSIIGAQSRQAAQQNFSGPGLRRLPFLLPPIHLQREFSEKVASLQRLRLSYSSHAADLDTLFASLQHRAFSGELTRASAPELEPA